MVVKIVFSYDGSLFKGFQRQKNVRNVQGEIEKALEKVYKCEIQIKGAGRTDAGVHALNQVASFEVQRLVPNLKKKLNSILNPDIVINSVSKEKKDFHARLSAKGKKYIYKINLGSYQSSLNNYYFQPNYKLDVERMKRAARIFVGKHDFKNFVAGQRDDYETVIYKIKLKKRFNKLIIEFYGAGFYRYMVRNLVGALLEIGKFKIYDDVIKEMLYNPDKKRELPTASPAGLYLAKVYY